jgi:hypothetical protein
MINASQSLLLLDNVAYLGAHSLCVQRVPYRLNMLDYTKTNTCTIPAGKAILIPFITGECDYLNSPDVTTESELLGCAMEGNEGAVMEFTIDGRRLKNLENYRVHSQVFNLTIASNNPFRSTSGTTQAIVDGFYVFLEPLSPGRHDIHFTGTIEDVTGPYSYATDVTYNLTLK